MRRQPEHGAPDETADDSRRGDERLVRSDLGHKECQEGSTSQGTQFAEQELQIKFPRLFRNAHETLTNSPLFI